MATKSFKGYAPTEETTIELESPDGTRKIEVRTVPVVAGSVVLDFMAETSEEDPGTLAAAVMKMLQVSILPEDWERFRDFIDDSKNGITLELLSEIAGFLAEAFSGRPTEPQPLSTVSS